MKPYCEDILNIPLEDDEFVDSTYKESGKPDEMAKLICRMSGKNIDMSEEFFNLPAVTVNFSFVTNKTKDYCKVKIIKAWW